MNDKERLINAVDDGRIGEVEDFLDRGANVDTTDAGGDSLLLRAVGEGHVELVKLLLERGADPLHVGGEGLTVWHWVPCGCSPQVARLLLPLNRHIDTRSDRGMSPLWYAVGWDSTEIIEFLLVNGADPNHSGSGGRSLLHYAASLGNEEGARLLLQYGARIDAKDEQGALPYECVPDNKPALLRELRPKDRGANAD